MPSALHPATEIPLQIGSHAVTLRASLRAAAALEALPGGIASVYDALARQKITPIHAVIRAAATDRREAEGGAMIEPGIALQTLIGDTLAAHPIVTTYVDPLHIRAGSIRPEKMPAIVLAPARVAMLGRAAGGQMVAVARLMLRLWAIED